MIKTKLIRVAVATAVVATGLVGAGAGAANAALDCTQKGILRDGRTLRTIGSIPIKSGPAAECPTYASISGSAVIWCKKKNTYGNIWFYVSKESQGRVGWVYQGDTTLYPDDVKWCNLN